MRNPYQVPLTLNRRERKAAFDHAKKHILDMFQEVLSEEHHSVMTVTGKDGVIDPEKSQALHAGVMAIMEIFFRDARHRGFFETDGKDYAVNTELKKPRRRKPRRRKV